MCAVLAQAELSSGVETRAAGGPVEGQGAHGGMEALHVLTGVEVTQVYRFVQTHLTELLRSVCFILCKSYFN